MRGGGGGSGSDRVDLVGITSFQGEQRGDHSSLTEFKRGVADEGGGDDK